VKKSALLVRGAAEAEPATTAGILTNNSETLQTKQAWFLIYSGWIRDHLGLRRSLTGHRSCSRA
jgi:hypothetical protein